MQLRDKLAVVTGGANGIGQALCRRFAAEGARGVVVADMDAAGAQQVAEEIDGLAVTVDVGCEADIQRLVAEATNTFGPIDLFCSNAGIALGGGVDAPDAVWQQIWDVHVMAHIYAARAVLPGMVMRGAGYLLQTASAAGLLTQVGSAPYSVTKHAAVALAEWLSITYAQSGIKVSCLCPQGVMTDMLTRPDAGPATERLAGRGLDARASGRRGDRRLGLRKVFDFAASDRGPIFFAQGQRLRPPWLDAAACGRLCRPRFDGCGRRQPFDVTPHTVREIAR